MEHIDRREFLLTSALFTATGCSSGDKVTGDQQGDQHGTQTDPPAYTLPDGAKIVFQGDSITDTDHNGGDTDPNDPAGLGFGYPLFLAQYLLLTYPNKQLQIYNRARGGDTVPLLQQRWQADALDLKPDLLSILIGINDAYADPDNPDVATIYEQNYKALIDQTRQALPNVTFVILEPYLMYPGGPVPQFQPMRDAAAAVAQYANAIYVPLQDMLYQRASAQTATYWIKDQAHPTIAGSAAIAKQWLQYVGV